MFAFYFCCFFLATPTLCFLHVVVARAQGHTTLISVLFCALFSSLYNYGFLSDNSIDSMCGDSMWARRALSI